MYYVVKVCNLKAGEFIHTLGDAHLYLNHLEQAKTQLSRKPKKSPQICENSSLSTQLRPFLYEVAIFIDF